MTSPTFVKRAAAVAALVSLLQTIVVLDQWRRLVFSDLVLLTWPIWPAAFTILLLMISRYEPRVSSEPALRAMCGVAAVVLIIRMAGFGLLLLRPSYSAAANGRIIVYQECVDCVLLVFLFCISVAGLALTAPLIRNLGLLLAILLALRAILPLTQMARGIQTWIARSSTDPSLNTPTAVWRHLVVPMINILALVVIPIFFFALWSSRAPDETPAMRYGSVPGASA